ncbi:hypothetical protein [Mesomycoplasma lagogenitalium]|uniref:Transposase n=1 Tax=Mesomycoplasma lagogenitalium TaxID=171286 RepID=A0ABY8LUH1_9BACT|nr:hypothetical protein [Mesomycoplasma lagogenitalium]WGI36895.1 hypothetical protein QEG99_01250 [Mesomycoplasma lagogenitalium]
MNLAHKAHQKSKRRSYHKYAGLFYKYQEFTKIFVSKYDKNFHGIEATYQFIKKNYPNIKIPSCRQIFNWFKSNRWELKKTDKLRKYYKKGKKRRVFFQNLKINLFFRYEQDWNM